ncbi:hypothetical protein OV079_46150 [Nannocystis pusilla]|uniref:Uncharacterized protein n=1 Tax=Nannocystis pusilla TaxID=889268 RepID=A0A9X3EYQ0_9BACT|nr:hypothetical protein [Nannocystis pusilla]MCY1012799.1 hypothetical protein [Nannocystis pusilla]
MVPPTLAATQTTPAMVSAPRRCSGPTQSAARKIRQVSSSVATVMPEIGFDDEPISPVKRPDTVTNRNANRPINSAPRKPTGKNGDRLIAVITPSAPSSTVFIDSSRSVRITSVLPFPAPSEDRPARSDETIVGSERAMLMMPPAATAPAPM